MNTLQQKLNRANGILAKLRYYVKADVLQTIYYAFLEYHMRLKNNSLKNNIIPNNCLFVFDNLTNNLLDVFDQFLKPFKELYIHNTKGSQPYLLNIPKTNTRMFGSNSRKIKSIKDWNKMIHKIHFSSGLIFKRNEFIKLVKNTVVT